MAPPPPLSGPPVTPSQMGSVPAIPNNSSILDDDDQITETSSSYPFGFGCETAVPFQQQQNMPMIPVAPKEVDDIADPSVDQIKDDYNLELAPPPPLPGRIRSMGRRASAPSYEPPPIPGLFASTLGATLEECEDPEENEGNNSIT